MIDVKDLTKTYGRTTAVRDLTFHIARGEIVGFLGPNGAGKTTTMRILSCYLPPSAGTVKIAGFDIWRDSLEVRRRIGYLPENVPLYTDMRVIEYLNFRARLKGLGGGLLRDRVHEVMQGCGLAEVGRTIIGKLSKGYRQRIGLADSLVHAPEVVILDEPTLGLDPNQVRHIRSLIKSLAKNHTVLLSSHILSEVEMICERVLIIDAGRIVASDTPRNLAGLMKGNRRFVLEVKGPSGEAASLIGSVPHVSHVAVEQRGDWTSVKCEGEKGVDIRPDLFRAVVGKRWELRELREEKADLEDVFVSLTADRAAEAPDAGAEST